MSSANNLPFKARFYIPLKLFEYLFKLTCKSMQIINSLMLNYFANYFKIYYGTIKFPLSNMLSFPSEWKNPK